VVEDVEGKNAEEMCACYDGEREEELSFSDRGKVLREKSFCISFLDKN